MVGASSAGASSGDLFDQRRDPHLGGRKGALSLQAGGEPVSQIQPMLLGSRGQSAERADDALTRTFGGLLRFDEEVVGVGIALMGFGSFTQIHRTLHISSTASLSIEMLYTFVTIYDFKQTFVETIRLVRPKSEKLPFGRGSQVSAISYILSSCLFPGGASPCHPALHNAIRAPPHFRPPRASPLHRARSGAAILSLYSLSPFPRCSSTSLQAIAMASIATNSLSSTTPTTFPGATLPIHPSLHSSRDSRSCSSALRFPDSGFSPGSCRPSPLSSPA
jgi:hypothetical protein